MSSFILLKIFFIGLLFCLVRCKQEYYWRDYYGKIPADAVPGGHDINNDITYIGQVFVLDKQLQIVRIYPGNTVVEAAMRGYYKQNKAIKILCSNYDHSKFQWIPANSKNVLSIFRQNHFVIGGHEWGSDLNIARIKFQGELLVGKICPTASGKMYFPYNGNEYNVDSYEALIQK